MHKTIKQVDSTALIVKYKGEDEEITEVNKNRIVVKAKNALLNYAETLPQFLQQIYEYFPNSRLNSKKFS